ncbi:nucleoplasmin-3 [Coturnix japonica]|uniref:nucleoplasmin-3 n=1 Tax=Coturnix japonica TaxID=93934 RepID=UPI000776F9C4|nr:nucleoplasmin-3 [Coturnix japonica]
MRHFTRSDIPCSAGPGPSTTSHGAAQRDARWPLGGAAPLGRAGPGAERGGPVRSGTARYGSVRLGTALLGTELPAPHCGLMEQHGPGSVLFGCELTASTKSYTFQVDEDDDSDHVLALSVVCLTDGAKDECNVVEVIGRNHKNQEISVPVANLKLSCQPLLSLDNFKLQPPVTFRLAAGSGPVHLAGWHQILHRDDASFEEFDDDDMSEEEMAPIVPAKKERRKQ